MLGVDIGVVVGNPKLHSRTLGMASELGRTLASSLGVDEDPLVVDLAVHAAEIFDPVSTRIPELLEQLASRRVLIVVSPTFKGSYTGLLKAFFDRYGPNALQGVVAVAAMTGAAQTHALAVEVHLRPLLVELGATVPARGLYVTEADLAAGRPLGNGWLDRAIPLIRGAVTEVGYEAQLSER